MRTLRNAVERGKVHHAYLFVGSRGTGKTSMAKILAACLNCGHGPDRPTPCGVCDSCVSIAQRHVARRDRDGRGLEQLGRRHPRPARARRLRAGLRAPQGLHPRRGAHALVAGLERVPQDARGAAAEHDLRARHDRGSKVLPTVVDRCHRFDFARPTVEQIASVVRRVAAAEGIEIAPRGHRARRAPRDRLVPRRARHARAARHLQRARAIAVEDVLAVLGVADAECCSAPRRRRLGRRARGAAARSRRLAERAATPASFARDLEAPRARAARRADARRGARASCADARARRAARRAGRARRRRPTSCALLDLLGAALEAVRDGADARTQLELALVKAAAPEVDPSRKALMSRIERLEAQLAARRAPERRPRPRAVAPAPPAPRSAPAVASTAAPPTPAADAPRLASATTSPSRSRPTGRRRRRSPTSSRTSTALRDLWPAVVGRVRDENRVLGRALRRRGRSVATARRRRASPRATASRARSTPTPANRRRGGAHVVGARTGYGWRVRSRGAGRDRGVPPARTSSSSASWQSSMPRRSSTIEEPA